MGIGARGARSRASPWSQTPSRRRRSPGGATHARALLYGLDPRVAASQATRASEELRARVWEARRVCARHRSRETAWSGAEPGLEWSGGGTADGNLESPKATGW